MITIYFGGYDQNLIAKQIIRATKYDKLNILIDSVLDYEFNSGLYMSPATCSIVRYLTIKKELLDTFSVYPLLENLKYSDFRLNDFDMVINFILSLELLKERNFKGMINNLKEKLGIQNQIIPLTDKKIDIEITVNGPSGPIVVSPFEYYSKAPVGDVTNIFFKNLGEIKILEDAKRAILKSSLLIICQPDPLSLYADLNLPGMKKTLEEFSGRVLAICQIMLKERDQSIMKCLGQSPTIFGLINLLIGLVDDLILDDFDSELLLKARAQDLGMEIVPLNYRELSEDEFKIIRKIIKITDIDPSYFTEVKDSSINKIKSSLTYRATQLKSKIKKLKAKFTDSEPHNDVGD